MIALPNIPLRAGAMPVANPIELYTVHHHGRDCQRTQRKPMRRAGIAARLLSRPCGLWRVPHGLGTPGDVAYMPYRVLSRPSVMGGYDACTSSSACSAHVGGAA